MSQCIKTKALKNILNRNLNTKLGLLNKSIFQVPCEKARLLIIFEIGKFQVHKLPDYSKHILCTWKG